MDPATLADADQSFAHARAQIGPLIDGIVSTLDRHDGDTVKTYGEHFPSALVASVVGGTVNTAGLVTMLALMLAEHKRAERDGTR